MSSKRKALVETLGRRVRARREESEEIEHVASSDAGESSNESGPETKATTAEESELESDDSEDEEDEESDSDDSEALDTAAGISFGALAKAHASLTAPSKKTSKTKPSSLAADGWEDKEASERKAGRADRRDFNRSSKHAPTEISSKKAVSRKREVVVAPKRVVRDPRFESLATGASEGTADDERTRWKYGFLDKYREDEMKELKEAIKIARDEDVKEKLKRALLSMESRKKAQARKDKEAEILREHRRCEKEKVKMGKQPFYLKKTEQKKRLLLNQFGELKGKQLDRVIERRRKKVEGKEKKKMPFARREAES